LSHSDVKKISDRFLDTLEAHKAALFYEA